MKSLLPLCLITTLFFVSCNDDDATPTLVTLPPITSEGLNTFGCLINGEPWVAMTPNSFEDELDVIFDLPNNFLQIHSNIITDDRDEFLSFSIKDVDMVKTYSIQYDDDVYINFSSGISYGLDTLGINFVEITKIDTSSKIVSGLFEFTLINIEKNDTLFFSEGRFDSKYRE